MCKITEQLALELFIWRAFRKYKNSLPTKPEYDSPKMQYHVLAGAVVWEDEGIDKCHPKLENAFRYALNYRTNLIVHENYIPENRIEKRAFKLAEKYFQNWIGFNKNRCSYSPELSDRIKRIKKVSEWKINKIMNSDEANLD